MITTNALNRYFTESQGDMIDSNACYVSQGLKVCIMNIQQMCAKYSTKHTFIHP